MSQMIGQCQKCGGNITANHKCWFDMGALIDADLKKLFKPNESPPPVTEKELRGALISGYDGEGTWSVWKGRAQRYARYALSLMVKWGEIKIKPELPGLTSLVATGKKAKFSHFQDEELWYETDDGFMFPVPVKDAQGGTFLAEDKAIFFMTHIRKQLEKLAKDAAALEEAMLDHSNREKEDSVELK